MVFEVPRIQLDFTASRVPLYPCAGVRSVRCALRTGAEGPQHDGAVELDGAVGHAPLVHLLDVAPLLVRPSEHGVHLERTEAEGQASHRPGARWTKQTNRGRRAGPDFARPALQGQKR